MFDLARRDLLAAMLAAGASSGVAAQSGRPSTGRGDPTVGPGRIDTHQHLLPPEFLNALERRGMSAWAPQTWSVDGALALMDRYGIATGVLSLSTPGPNLGDDAEARVLARRVNERQAALVQARPDRFGMFACLPLPDIDGSLVAIAHAYDDLRTDGVVILANSRGVYAGDPSFDPVMEELNRRSAIVFIHPGPLPGPPVKGIHPSLADFLLDTTRAAINLVSRSIPRRFPRLRIILSHGGGFLPYAASRIASLSGVIDRQVDDAAMMADLRSFYFDTALSGSPSALPSLLAFAKPGHVLFGSDWPYCPEATVGRFTAGLDVFTGPNAAARRAIDRGAAEALFPRLAAKVT